jgi:hypothetical protein
VFVFDRAGQLGKLTAHYRWRADRSRQPGHAILIEPDGRAIASPVWTEPDCLEPFGDLTEISAAELWSRFPYKENHLNKYLERSMMVVE